jgi:hypothetical protein
MFYFIFGFCVKKNLTGQDLRKSRRKMRQSLAGHYEEQGVLDNLYDFGARRRRSSAVVVGITGDNSDNDF